MTFDPQRLASIVLCGGRSTRMGLADRNKVTLPVAGRPAVCRALQVYESCGIGPQVVVVGFQAGQVLETVGPEHPNVVYVYQPQQRGTGNAARCGAQALRRLGFDGHVLVVAGDKVVQPRAVRRLLEAARRDQADLALVTGPASHWPTAGRVVQAEDGRPLGIVEVRDLEQARAARRTFRLGGREWTAEGVERAAPYANLSVYLFRLEALHDALQRLSTDNAQQEEYLTDAVALLADSTERAYRVLTVPVEAYEDVMAFNTPDELAAVEEHLRRAGQAAPAAAGPAEVLPGNGTAESRPPEAAAPPAVWREFLSRGLGFSGAANDAARMLREALDLFERRFRGTRPVVLVRAPGRANLMGRHVDHRGGHVNLIALDREIVCVAAAREDREVCLYNVDDAQFPPRVFNLDELLEPAAGDDWWSYINDERVRAHVRGGAGDWANYVKAAVLRLQLHRTDRRLCGMDLVVHGNIPMQAGLSSSSALVVAAFLAAAALNGLSIEREKVVDLCGDGEWYVGTRGGAGDHAAILLARANHVAHVSFSPFAIQRYVPFPQGYRLVIADSLVHAPKSGKAREAFNRRIFAYEAGIRLLRAAAPRFADRIKMLRDVNPATLGCTTSEIYSALIRVPEEATFTQLVEEQGEEEVRALADRCGIDWPADPAAEAVPVRPVLLFGIAECARSRLAASLLAERRLDTLGALMRISHDGDRVVTTGPDGRPQPFRAPCDDRTLRRLSLEARSADPALAQTYHLAHLPGAYGCSTVEIDTMVDLVLRVKGVVGAQLAGAGLGGCIMILCQEGASEEVIERLSTGYYAPRGQSPVALDCRPGPRAEVLAAGAAAAVLDDSESKNSSVSA